MYQNYKGYYNRQKVKKEIIINVSDTEIRTAIIEDSNIAELHVETQDRVRTVGDIYLGRVHRVMPGIRAAFVDIGQPIDGFLHFSDVATNLDSFSSLISVDDDNDYEVVDEKSQTDDLLADEPETIQRPSNGHEEQVPNLERDQELLVQVVKEPMANKGSRLTTNITIAGRFLVLMPFAGTIGVSKKIFNFKEKRRLRKIVSELLPKKFGVIIRTNAENIEDELIKKDINQLLKKWRLIEDAVKTGKAPQLIYKDATMISSVVRDLLNDQVDRIVIDDKKIFKQIKSYVKWAAPNLDENIGLYKGKEPIFDQYGIEKDVESAFARKVWLKSGGYLIIEHTEAMVVIDVNSGRYAGKKEQELNSLKTNMEAARELCRQLRLRDIGGIIVVDFIDLQEEKNRKKVYEELRKEFRRDRAKSNVLPMTEFGLIQITRQRIRPSVLHTVSETCPVCGGSGTIQSRSNIIQSIERWIMRLRSEGEERRITIKVHPSVASLLNAGNIFSTRMKWMFRYKMQIRIETDQAIHIHDYRVFSYPGNDEITERFTASAVADDED